MTELYETLQQQKANILDIAKLLDQVGLIDALSNALGRRVDIVSERALNKHLRQWVLQEVVPL